MLRIRSPRRVSLQVLMQEDQGPEDFATSQATKEALLAAAKATGSQQKNCCILLFSMWYHHMRLAFRVYHQALTPYFMIPAPKRHSQGQVRNKKGLIHTGRETTVARTPDN